MDTVFSEMQMVNTELAREPVTWEISTEQSMPSNTPHLGSYKCTLPLRLLLSKICLSSSIWLDSSYIWTLPFLKQAKWHFAFFSFSLLLKKLESSTFKACLVKHISYYKPSLPKHSYVRIINHRTAKKKHNIHGSLDHLFAQRKTQSPEIKRCWSLYWFLPWVWYN